MSPIGCTYNENGIGPSTEPCGTPHIKVVSFDETRLIETFSSRDVDVNVNANVGIM